MNLAREQWWKGEALKAHLKANPKFCLWWTGMDSTDGRRVFSPADCLAFQFMALLYEAEARDSGRYLFEWPVPYLTFEALSVIANPAHPMKGHLYPAPPSWLDGLKEYQLSCGGPCVIVYDGYLSGVGKLIGFTDTDGKPTGRPVEINFSASHAEIKKEVLRLRSVIGLPASMSARTIDAKLKAARLANPSDLVRPSPRHTKGPGAWRYLEWMDEYAKLDRDRTANRKAKGPFWARRSWLRECIRGLFEYTDYWSRYAKAVQNDATRANKQASELFRYMPQ